MDRGISFIDRYGNLVLAIGLSIGLYLASLYSYNLFHSLAELFSVVVAASVFVLSWNSRRFFKNGYLLFVGIALLFVGGIDLVHTLAYKGMGVFVGYDANLPTELWIGARYLQALTFLAAPLFLHRKPPASAVIGLYAGLTSLLLASIFVWDVFPDCFIEGVGVTPFKRVSEYVISGILLVAVWLLYRNDHSALDQRVVYWLSAAMLMGVASELSFSDYASVYGFANLAGHYFKIISFYLIYKAIIETGLIEPYKLLFRDLKRHEEALEARTAELQREVAERRRAEAALERYAAALKRSNHDLQDFAYVASHDLQEPLRKIRSFGERLQSRYSEGLGADGRDYLGRMLNAADRMQNLMGDLLQFSRISTQGQPFAPVDLQEVAEGVLSDLEVRLDETGGRVQVGELPMIEADAYQMRQLLQNLIGNALKFHKQGVPPEVKVYVNGPADRKDGAPAGTGKVDGLSDAFIHLVVEDNGIGFDEKYVDRIFQPFQRLHGQNEYRGSGIGLAICQKIVERHDGMITAHSRPGEGSKFMATLPKRHMKT